MRQTITVVVLIKLQFWPCMQCLPSLRSATNAQNASYKKDKQYPRFRNYGNYKKCLITHLLIFIHSWQRFIEHLFKGNYSEALPTPARPNNTDVSRRRNVWDVVLGRGRIKKGRLFQTEGPSTEKAWFSLVAMRTKGNCKRPCSATLWEQVPWALLIGLQSSVR